MTRTEACLFYDISFVAETKAQDGVVPVKYEARYEVHFQVKTDAHGDSIKTWVQINPVYNNFPGDENAVVMGAGDPNAWFDSMCVSAACNAGGDSNRQNIDFYGDLTWKGGISGNTPVDTHMATGTADHKWNGSVQNASGTTDGDLSAIMAVSFNARPVTYVDPPPGIDGRKREWKDDYTGWQSPSLIVACDKVAFNGTPGCVLPQYAPTYRFNTAAYPEAAAHAWVIQNKSKIAGVGQSWDAPLKYLAPQARNKEAYEPQRSRDAMCTRYQGAKSASTGWVPRKTFLPHPKTALHHVGPHLDEVNCDEFPFASTYQSAGMKAVNGGLNEAPNGGADCIQTVSAVADDGKTHFLDDTRYDAPSFTENCGRSSMSGDVNQGSMRPFGEFAKAMRLLDTQDYFLDPGNAWFKGCDTSKAVLVCTMAKP